MVEQAFYDGDSRCFMQRIKEYNIELWDTRFLFDTIARDSVLKASDRCDAHYELVRDLIYTSIEERTIDWNDDDTMQEWIHLLVEQRYPWFVCSLWNHLRPTAISFLHNSSMQCCHTGNLHQLLRQELIANLWDSDDFMSSSVDQAIFFNHVEKGSKSFRKTFRKQLVYFPYSDEHILQQLVEVLLMWKSHSVMKMFLSQPDGDNIRAAIPNLTARICQNHDIALLDWMLERETTALTTKQWFDMFYNVYGHYFSARKNGEDTAAAYKICIHLMKIFHERHDPTEWLELLVQSHYEISFLTLFIHSKHATQIFDTLWSYTNDVLDVIPDDYTTHIQSLNIDFQWKSIARSRLLFIIDELCANSSGWTAFANALRWGKHETVVWILHHCLDNELIANLEVRTSSSPSRVDNALTLALFNPEPEVYKQILQRDEINSDQIQKWIVQQDGTPFITALTRLFFFHPLRAVERFKHLLTHCPSLTKHKNNMLMVFHDAWCNHYNIPSDSEAELDTQISQHDCFLDCPLLNELLDIKHPCVKEPIVALLLRCTNDEHFQSFLHRHCDSPSSPTLIKEVYLNLVSQKCVKMERLEWIEELGTFREMMASTIPDVHRFYLAWSTRSADVFNAFVQRMIHKWHQPAHRVMPCNYSFYTHTHMHITEQRLSQENQPVLAKWRLWLSMGLVPLCMYSEHNWPDVPHTLQKMLKAHRLIRRMLKRKSNRMLATRDVHHQRKKMRFMVRCNPHLQRWTN